MSKIPRIVVEFSGGCELLFGNESTITMTNIIPEGATIAMLVLELRNNYCRERPEQFAIPVNTDIGGANVRLRPGVLALVNDCDAEVVGGEDYELQDGDTVAFISTLHGG